MVKESSRADPFREVRTLMRHSISIDCEKQLLAHTIVEQGLPIRRNIDEPSATELGEQTNAIRGVVTSIVQDPVNILSYLHARAILCELSHRLTQSLNDVFLRHADSQTAKLLTRDSHRRPTTRNGLNRNHGNDDKKASIVARHGAISLCSSASPPPPIYPSSLFPNQGARSMPKSNTSTKNPHRTLVVFRCPTTLAEARLPPKLLAITRRCRQLSGTC
jgi:hypothetical protein